MMHRSPPVAAPLLTEAQREIVREAFLSMASPSETIPLDRLVASYNVAEHPSVKVGNLAPSAVRETLLYQFGECQKDHSGSVAYDEFVKYHEKVADEARQTLMVNDMDAYLEDLFMRIWRRGLLLAPTGLRPVIPIDEYPQGLYSKTLMSLVWPGVNEAGESVLYCINDMIQPIFRRGELPPPLQGFFAFPSELMGFPIVDVTPQISIKRWLDFVWEYEEGKYAAVEGIISARVPTERLPEDLRVLIMEHSDALKLPFCTFLETYTCRNPMYKKSSESYGYRVREECKKIAKWKWGSLAGKVYGLQYHGTTENFFSKNGPSTSNAATGMNL